MKKPINNSPSRIANSLIAGLIISSLIALISNEYQKEQTLLAKNNHETQNPQH